MKTLLHLTLLLFLLLTAACKKDTAPVSKGVAIYMVGHNDDWQLFMGLDFLKDLGSGKKIILITTSSGCQESTYCNAREEGAIASIDYALDAKGVKGQPFIGNQQVGAYSIPYYKNGPVTAYFLRLPDGNADGEGFAALGKASMTKLYNGKIEQLVSTDSVNIYYNRQQLVKMLHLLVAETLEPTDFPVTLNIPDTLESANPSDHADHIVTAKLGLEAFGSNGWDTYAYTDYASAFMQANLSNEEFDEEWKLFSAYDTKVTEEMGFCTTCYSDIYYKFCWRLYKRKL
ncbi:MAG: hypothetical protein U0V74_10285 [Chitinophagales bacterium]